MSGEVRSVVVRLSASVAGYLSGMGQADAATAKVEKGLERLNKKTLTTDQVMGKVGKFGGRLFLGAAAGIAIAEKKAADFNSEMATVYTLSHANTRQQDLLAKAAKSVGVNIGYSATESASAEEELIKAGVKLKDILGGGLKGALDLAAAGQTDVGTATEVAASAMTQFKLKGKDVPHIADLLAAGADKALGSVTDLGYGLSQVGTQAHQMGFKIEETVGTLAEFAQSGLIGEKGGTTLKQMFLQLAAPTDKASKLMKKYGVSLYDANGQIKSMPELAGNLQKSFKGLDPATRNYALGVIFGSRAIQGANILIADGEKKNRKWIDSVNDQGFAAHQASGKMNSLKGDLQKLDAQLGNALIGQGGKQGFLRGMTQDATKLVKKFNELSDAQKSIVGKGFVGAAAVGGALWTANKIYSAAKGTAALYRGVGGMLGRGSAASAGGTVSRAFAQPVIVTNWPPGFGMGGAGGASAVAGEGATVVGGVPKSTSRRALAKVATVGMSAVELAMAAAINQQVQDAVGQIGSRGRENGILKNFDKPRSTKASVLAGGSSHSVKHDTNAALGAQKFGGVFSGLDQKLAGLIGGDGLSKSVKNVKELDTALSKVATADQTKGWAQYNEVLKKSGLSADQLNKVLPKTARSLTASGKATGGVRDMLLQTVPATAKYARQLRSLPSAVRTKVESPGAITSMADVRTLKKQYDLTPKQVRTLVALTGAKPAKNATDQLIKSLTTADHKHAKPKVSQQGAGPAKAAVDALRNAIAALHDKSVNVTVVRNTKGGSAPGGGVANQPGVTPGGADGMTVPKSGRGYADRYHVMVADGEEIISNRHGQADQFRRDRASGRIPRYAAGGTVGAVSGGTGTTSVTVTFPSPAIYATAVKAADDIAAAAVKTTATAKDLRSVHLDDLHQQQQIRDLQKSLAEHNKKTVGKGKSKHTVKGKFTLTGLDRTTAAAELADAKATLVEMRKQSDVAKQLADAQQEARDAQQQARKDEAASLSGGDILARGLSPTSVINQVNRLTTDIAQFGNVVARLRNAKASPALLSRMKDLADSGDFRSAIRLGQALLDQPALLGQLNASLTNLTNTSTNVANLTTDPRFLTSAAWNPTGQTVSTVQAQVVLAADPSTWTADIMRQLQHYVDTQLAGVVK